MLLKTYAPEKGYSTIVEKKKKNPSIILDPIDLNQVENLPLKLTARMWLSSSLPSILLAIRGQRPGYP